MGEALGEIRPGPESDEAEMTHLFTVRFLFNRPLRGGCEAAQSPPLQAPHQRGCEPRLAGDVGRRRRALGQGPLAEVVGHGLVDLKGPNAPLRVYSYRPSARKTGLIEHTFKFPDFQNRRSSPSLKNTILRAELWADKDGKAIPAERVGGLLNSSVPKSRRIQTENGARLRLTGIDVVRHKGRNYENKPFNEKLKALREITRGTKGVVETPPIAVTPEEKRQMLEDVQSSTRMPETREGVILQQMGRSAPPTKVKFKPQDDVYVRGVFSKSRGAAKGHAGGFEYSITPDGPVVGKVGTGFSHAMRKDMMDNPDKYVGRVAKVKSQGPYRSGALRAPSFDEWHIDKTPPELLKEAGKRAGELYHGSPYKLERLEPRLEHGDPKVPDAVFGTPIRTFALAYAGGKWGDRDINQSVWYDKDDNPIEMSLREMRPGALKDIYKGRRGYMYTLPSDGFELPPRRGARWEQLNRSAATPTKVEEIEDVMAALEADPLARIYSYDPKHPRTREAIQRSVSRMREMEPDDAEKYKKWRLERATPEIAAMLEEEMLKKESQDATLAEIKRYRERAVREATPDKVVTLAQLAGGSTRGIGAANVGMRLLRQHIDTEYPGAVNNVSSNIRSRVGEVSRWKRYE